ncbi:MAG: hypothetical protein HND48_21880 [Chloroflexi bacterium]|nr:hypothetical protein [Chloroflexota bacterium]
MDVRPAQALHRTWMQQGRVLTDSDFNEDEVDQRRGAPARAHRRDRAVWLAGRRFPRRERPANRRQYRLRILDGTLYLGGLRLGLEAAQTFRLQSDRLQTVDVSAPAANTQRRDLVFIEAYEAPVTAVEDSELLDPALGGRTRPRAADASSACM